MEETKAIDTVEVLDSDINFEEQPEEMDTKTQEEPEETPDTDPGEEEPVDSNEPVKITLGDEAYTEAELSDAVEALRNKKEWSKSNTEKAQGVADQRKAVEPILQFAEKVRSKPEFAELLKEAVEEEFGDDGINLFDSMMSTDKDSLVNPFKDELDQVTAELNEVKAKASLDQAKVDLKNQFKLKKAEVEEVVDFAVKILEDTGRLITLEESYKVMNYDKPKQEIKAKPKPPKTAKKDRGAKQINANSKAVKTYEDISVDGFDLFA